MHPAPGKPGRAPSALSAHRLYDLSKAPSFASVQVCQEPTEPQMLLTMHLSETETQTYAVKRDSIRADVVRFARKGGQRFAQIVGTDGRILDVLETK